MASSIRDFDPLLKRKAQTHTVASATPAPTITSSGKVSPIKLSVGRTHIRATAEGPAAVLGRNLNKAFSELSANLAWFTDQLEGYLPQDLMEAMLPTFNKSKEYCPKDTGRLVASAFMEMEGFRGGARVVMGYGRGDNPVYSIYVHELPATHAPPTRYKFLQAAVEEDYYTILQRATDRVQARFG